MDFDLNEILSLSKGVFLFITLSILVKADIKELCIPTNICLTGTITGPIMTLLSYILIRNNDLLGHLKDQILAIVIGLIFMRLISKLSKLITGRNCLGLGDADLAALAGAWLGVQGMTTAISISFITAAIYSLVGFITGFLKPWEPFAFGPFIAGGIWGVWCLNNKALWFH